MSSASYTALQSKPDALHAAEPAATVVHGISCANCNLRETCLTGGVRDRDLERVANIVYSRRRVKRGERLFREGEEFKSLYAIRGGFFKTSVLDGDGREQITGFFMTGELLGMDGLGSGRFEASATALDESIVCAMPYSLIDQIGREIPALQRRLHSVLAREIVRGHGIMMLLGSMNAEQRLATFLLNLSKRFAARGYSPASFQLRMTRDEIGSFLGLKIETVSRLFTKFHGRGLIAVRQKHVVIADIKGLEGVLAPVVRR